MDTIYELYFALEGNEVEHYKIIKNLLKNYNLEGAVYSCSIVVREKERVEISDGFKIIINDNKEDIVKTFCNTVKTSMKNEEVYVKKIQKTTYLD